MTRICPLVSGLVILGSTLFLSTPVLAQFDGDYAIANWAEIRDGSPCSCWSCSWADWVWSSFEAAD